MPTVRVAVIGGGAAGIVAAKCLRDEGHSVVVFEKSSSVGGVWKYDGDPTADSCTYKSLRTNLPTVVMQLKNFPLPKEVPCYPSHVAVFDYLKSYATHFKVDEVVRLNSTVSRVHKDVEKSVWKVNVSSLDRGGYEEEFDRIVVCNGHFSKPYYLTVKGIENFHGERVHSKIYRTPEAFRNKTVLIIGRGPSGEEISRELVENGATSVVVSSQKFVVPSEGKGDNQNQSDGKKPQASLDHVEADGTLVLSDGTRLVPSSGDSTPSPPKQDADDLRVMKPEIDFIDSSGRVHFTDETCIESPDAIIFCTGYVYSFGDVLPPKLLFPDDSKLLQDAGLDQKLSDEVVAATAAGHAVAPLYKQVFVIRDPTVAFIGLTFDTTTFQCFELQSIWVSRIFSGFVKLPAQTAMLTDYCDEIREMKPPLSKSIHCLGLKHFRYFTEIATLSKCEVDVLDFVLFGDAAYLLVNFDDFRSATFIQDPGTGKWTRRFKPRGSDEELVKTFE